MKVTSSNPVQGLEIFFKQNRNFFNCEHHSEDHSYLIVNGVKLFPISAQAQISITAKEPTGSEKEGSSYTFEWDFNLPSSGSLREIVFGLWEKGYTSSYFMTVTKRYGAVENPELRKKHPDYVGRVQWMGDISASYAAFRLENLRLSDNKTYGCQLGIGDYGQTIDSKITLIVLVRVE